jgi:hypothetical protein
VKTGRRTVVTGNVALDGVVKLDIVDKVLFGMYKGTRAIGVLV